MRFILLLISFCLIFSACQKEKPAAIPTSASHVFFKDQRDMIQQIQLEIVKRYPGDSLQEITNVSYIDSRDKSYALVFYKSKKRSGNLLMEQSYQQGVLVSTSSGTCEGLNCNCQIVTTITSAGDVKISCSCTTCTMLINQSAVSGGN